MTRESRITPEVRAMLDACAKNPLAGECWCPLVHRFNDLPFNERVLASTYMFTADGWGAHASRCGVGHERGSPGSELPRAERKAHRAFYVEGEINATFQRVRMTGKWPEFKSRLMLMGYDMDGVDPPGWKGRVR